MIEARVLAALIEALCIVESGGRAEIPGQDDSGPVGILQIKPCVIEELTRARGRGGWTLDDRKKPWRAKAALLEYILMKIDRGNPEGDFSIEEIMMLVKKGPTGMRREWTEADKLYIARVKELMKRLM
jgi:hypothetical protein